MSSRQNPPQTLGRRWWRRPGSTSRKRLARSGATTAARGPVLTLNGQEGEESKWCAGFVCQLVRQACDALHRPVPFEPSFACNILGARLRSQFGLIGSAKADAIPAVPSGSIFLLRGRATGTWRHTGILTRLTATGFDTIEGNTNSGGSANGYEVRARARPLRNVDFAILELPAAEALNAADRGGERDRRPLPDGGPS